MAADPRLREVAPGLHELTLPLPFPVEDHVNTLLLTDGRGQVDMVDCGLNEPVSLQVIQDAVQEVGGRGARLRRLVVTHIHADHFGAAGLVGAEEVYLHRLEVALVAARYGEMDALVEQVGNWLVRNGTPPEEAARVKEASRFLGELVTPARQPIVLDGGETLTLGGRDHLVLWTPGHSPGHICLYDAKRRILYGGDQMLPQISSNIGLHPQSTPNPVDEYLESLDRLDRLSPDRVIPGHGDAYANVSEVARDLRDHHLRRKDRILEVIGDRTVTGWEVAVELWGLRPEVYDRRLALQEGLAHLQSLAVEGRVRKAVDADLITWSVAG